MINSVVLVGRLTRDVEVKKTTSSLSVTSFTLAVDNQTKDVNGNKTTSFITCTAWRQTADFLSKYTHKGSLIGVEGRLQQRSYERKDGSKASVLEVVVSTITLLESKGASASRNENKSTSVDSAPIDEPDDSQDLVDTSNSEFTDNDLPF